MNKKVQISIKSIKENSCEIKEMPLAKEELHFGKNLHLGYMQKNAIDENDELITSKMDIAYFTSDNNEFNNDNRCIHLVCTFTFQIKGLSSIIKKDENENILLPASFSQKLLNISLGAMRGILAVKTASSFWSEFPLPLVDDITKAQ